MVKNDLTAEAILNDFSSPNSFNRRQIVYRFYIRAGQYSGFDYFDPCSVKVKKGKSSELFSVIAYLKRKKK